MLSIKDRIQLDKHRKKLRKLKSVYEAEIKKAEKEGRKRTDIQSIIDEARAHCADDEFEIEKIETRELVDKARKLHIELSKYHNEDVWQNVFGYYILTGRGRSILSRQIKVQQRENYRFVIEIISILIGLIGALTGLLAVVGK